MKILRFAHAFEAVGGVERYLNDLDNELINKYEIEISRLYMSNTTDKIQKIKGISGSLSLVPVAFVDGNSVHDSKRNPFNIAKKALVYLLYGKLVGNGIALKISRNAAPQEGIIEDRISKYISDLNPDLLVFHYIGGLDTMELRKIARNLAIPFAITNHFANDRLANLSQKTQVFGSCGVSGVSDKDVPQKIKDRFFNVADGIDTEFYKRNKNRDNQYVNIFLPARFSPTKGQMELLELVIELMNLNIDLRLTFAGRIDDKDYHESIKKKILTMRYPANVRLMGELDREGIKNEFENTDLLLFPTYHHEGMPRILIEAQSMEIPVITYDIGGTATGLINDKTGFVIPSGNKEMFKEKSIGLIKDKKKRETFGKTGRKFVVENFSIKSLAERHMKFYTICINNAKNKNLVTYY
ncbi:MAG: glycosyltransferase family 4 protein [Fibrobacter sp.]|nr:glycosyltransferase family 4 protein [Fibrobacter sp.]